MSAFCYDTPNDGQSEANTNTRRIYVGVFFDGTCNNRENVEAREEYEKGTANDDQKKAFEKNHSTKPDAENDNSYHNDHTNVDKLQKAIVNNAKYFSIYIEGSGTMDLDGDDTMDGTGFGAGKNGIRGKVRYACSKVAQKFDKTVKSITIDVFGFSRGAAAARNFVYEIKRTDGISSLTSSDNDVDYQRYETNPNVPQKGFLGYYLKNNKNLDTDAINKIEVTIRFVGIYDTVASYSPDSVMKAKNYLAAAGVSMISRSAGIGMTLGQLYKTVKPDFENGIKKLMVNDISKYSDRIVHLVAEDEHRKNFAITYVPKNDKTSEITLYGVHSDIGGGYVDGKPEKSLINLQQVGMDKLQAEKEILGNNGWFRGSQLTIDDITFPRYNQLNSSRTKLYSSYSRIPLGIMVNEWQKCAENITLDSFEMGKHKISEVADATQSLIRRMIQYRVDGLIKRYRDKGISDKIPGKEFLNEVSIRLHTNLLESPPKESELLYYFKNKIDNNQSITIRTDSQLCVESGILFCGPYIVAENAQKNLPKLMEKIIEQIFFRELRNKYLHWSASFAGFLEINEPNITDGGLRRRPEIAG